MGTFKRKRHATGVAEEDIFSEEKSHFNKERYLPIARDVPVKISNICCDKLKKSPMKRYQHKTRSTPITAMMAEESRLRKQIWLKRGCNSFETKNPKSNPMSFWTNQDVLEYIVINGLEICSIYGDIITTDKDGFEYPASTLTLGCGELKCAGCQRTGCIFCGFGFHNERVRTRFKMLAETHPRQYEYSIGGGSG